MFDLRTEDRAEDVRVSVVREDTYIAHTSLILAS